VAGKNLSETAGVPTRDLKHQPAIDGARNRIEEEILAIRV
jgi:hypothetical protein